MNLDTEEIRQLENTYSSGGQKINITTEHLTDNHRYNITIFTSNLAGSAISYFALSE